MSTTATASASFAPVVVRHAVRVLFGLTFFAAGLAYFFGVGADGPLPEGAAGDFVKGLGQARYFMPLPKSTEVICGVLLLANRFVPLALVVLAPIVINIVAVHTFLMPEGLVVALVLLALHLVLAWIHRKSFATLVTARA